VCFAETKRAHWKREFKGYQSLCAKRRASISRERNLKSSHKPKKSAPSYDVPGKKKGNGSHRVGQCRISFAKDKARGGRLFCRGSAPKQACCRNKKSRNETHAGEKNRLFFEGNESTSSKQHLKRTPRKTCAYRRRTTLSEEKDEASQNLHAEERQRKLQKDQKWEKCGWHPSGYYQRTGRTRN